MTTFVAGVDPVISDCEITRIVRCLDGDTIEGIRTGHIGYDDDDELLRRDRSPRELRILGVDTAEEKGATRAAGERATRDTERWLAARPYTLRARCYGEDPFGRIVADVYDAETGETLTEHLLALGHPPYVERR
jgi:endonuclease YncB( thermonuclease family)